MNDEKENQKISNGLEAIFSQTPTHPLNQQDWEKMKTSLGVAYQTLVNEAKKNQPLKWQDGSEIVLFGEKVKMFQSTEKQYKNSQMFGNLDYPSLSQYPNTNVATLDDLGKLNGLDNNSLKYRSELFGIIGNSHKTKQDNLGLLNTKYNQYYNGDRAEPLFWEGLVMGNGIANSLNKATNSAVNTGKTLSSQAESYLGNFANKYPNLSGAVADGVLSGGVHIGYKLSTGQDINGYELGGAIAGGALTRNHSLGNQIRINIGVATVSSLSKDPSGRDLTNAYFGSVISPIVGKLASSTGLKYNNIYGAGLEEYIGDLENRSKNLDNIKEMLNKKVK